MASATPDLRQTYGYLPNRRAVMPLTGTKSYYLLTEAHVCEQLTQGCYLKEQRPGLEPFEPATYIQ